MARVIESRSIKARIGVATATCYRFSQNEQREDDARTKQSSRERASWSIIPHVLSARDARHRRRTFPRDNRNVSTKIPSDIICGRIFQFIPVPVKCTGAILIVPRGKLALRRLLSSFFFASHTSRFSFISYASPLLTYIRSIQLLFFAVLPVYRALWICMCRVAHAKRARISKETFSSRCNPVPVEFRMHPGCYLSIQHTGRLGNIESSSNDSIVLTHKSTFIRTVTVRGRWTFYVRAHFTSDAARHARTVNLAD